MELKLRFQQQVRIRKIKEIKSDFEAWHGSDDLNVIPNYPTLFDSLGIFVWNDKELCSI